MTNFKQPALVIALSLFATSTLASEVYIDQSGSGSTINITQTGTSNIISGDLNTTSPAIISGSGLDIDVSQIGDYNQAEINLLNSATSTTLDFTATGSFNILDLLLNGATGSIVTSAITGDYNRLTVCGSNNGTANMSSATSTSGPLCSSGITANDTETTVTIGGDANIVNLEVGSAAGTTNSITIGDGLVAGNENIINITQSNIDVNHVTLTVEGSSNVIGIIQD